MEKASRKEKQAVTLEGVFVGNAGVVRDFYVTDYSCDDLSKNEEEEELEKLRGCRVMAELSEHSKRNDEGLLNAFTALTSAYSSMNELADNRIRPQYAMVKLTGKLEDCVPGYRKIVVHRMEIEQNSL